MTRTCAALFRMLAVSALFLSGAALLSSCATDRPALPAIAAAPKPPPLPTAPVPLGYIVIQSVAVKGLDSDKPAALQLLEDDRLTPDLRQQLWGKVIDPAREELRNKAFTLAHPGVVVPSRSELRLAELRLVLAGGDILFRQALATPLAGIEDVSLYGSDKMSYLLTEDGGDPTTTAGVLQTMPLDITGDQLLPISFVNEATHRLGTIRLPATKHAAWRLVEARDGDGKEIESISCNPAVTLGHFGIQKAASELTYSTYLFDGKQWHEKTQHKPGCWEDDDDFPPQGDFP